LLTLFAEHQVLQLKGKLFLLSTVVEFDQCIVSGNDIFVLNSSIIDDSDNLQVRGSVRQNDWYFSQVFRFKLKYKILPHCFYK